MFTLTQTTDTDTETITIPKVELCDDPNLKTIKWTECLFETILFYAPIGLAFISVLIWGSMGPSSNIMAVTIGYY